MSSVDPATDGGPAHGTATRAYLLSVLGRLGVLSVSHLLGTEYARTQYRPVRAARLVRAAVLVVCVMTASVSCAEASQPAIRVSPGDGVSRMTARLESRQRSVGLLSTFQKSMSDAGPVWETTLDGRLSGVRMRVWVWLPPQYYEPAFAHVRFPALMLYPGGSGVRHNAWVGPSLGARELVATGSRAGTLTPFVLVMPEMQLSVDRDTECADLPGQPAIGTFLAEDVRAMVLANFRVLADRDAWGAAGVSSGAYCAARLTFNHPDQFAAVASLDGYFTIETNLPGAQSPAIRAQDPWAIAASRPPRVSVLLWSGDGADLTVAQQFLAHVRAPTTAELKVLPGGQHLTEDIAKMVPQTLQYFTAHLGRPH